MRTGTDRLKIVCSRCKTTVCYWVRDTPPIEHEPARSMDVELLDGSHPFTGGPTPDCPGCGAKNLGFHGNTGPYPYMIRTTGHADE